MDGDLRPLGRRRFLHRSAQLLAAMGLARPARAQSRDASRMRLVLLGTGGGPRPKKDRSAPAQAIVVGDDVYVVDCGNGVARQMVRASLSLTRLRHIFITHHHSDHNADYGNLVLLGWAAGLQSRIDAWGPPPLQTMTKLFLETNDLDIRTRIADEGRVPLAPLVHAHEITAGGLVMANARVRVTAALVQHPPLHHAFAYRFDAGDQAIVISGDTRRDEALINLAKGADVLVHEALYVPAVDRLVARVPNASTLKQHILDSHTSVEDCGRIAAAAGVTTLVLSHLVPSDDPLVTDAMWIAAARPHFAGDIIVASDLMEV